MAVTGSTDLFGIGREHAFVVRLAIAGVDILGGRIELIAVGFQSRLDHADAALGENASLQGLIGLQAYNHFVLLVDIAGAVGGKGLRQTCLGIIHAFFTFHLKHLAQLVPKFQRALRRTHQETFVAGVGRIIMLDKVADIDFPFPSATFKMF